MLLNNMINISALVLFLYQERYKSVPDDIAKDLKGVLSQLRKHEALVHELAGTEQQVHKESIH